jgi:hypothetical protein
VSIVEPAREIDVIDHVDVVVAGGGVSGCAAAVAAAREGAQTVLIERNGVLGGVATAGLMANIGNLYLTGDGQVVIRGIAKEVVDRLAARGAASSQWASRELPGVVIDSEQLKVLLVEMQQEAGVQVLTHMFAARSIMTEQAVCGVYVESKMGRQAILAQVVVDATGEADIAYQAGCPMRFTSGSASLEFKMGQVDLDGLYRHFKRHPETFPVGMDMVKGFAEFERNWVERGVFFFPHGGGTKWDIFQKAVEAGEFQPTRGILWRLDAAGLYGLKGSDTVVVNSNFWRVETLDTARVSEAELEAQKACYYVAAFFRDHVPGFERATIVQLANDLGIRVSRGIEGEATLLSDQVESDHPVRCGEGIGRQPARASFEKSGEFLHTHTFDIPYGVLVPRRIENLLVGSGKSVSCQPQGLIRGMSGCMIVGQAAGVAAALAAKQHITPRALDVAALRSALAAQAVDLG